MGSVYLSIDLDFWQEHKRPQSADKFFGKVFSLDCPMYFVAEHQELLARINKRDFSQLINVDYHDDLMSNINTKESANDADWAGFVKWSCSGKYTWLVPNELRCVTEGHGVCDVVNDVTLANNVWATNVIQRALGWKVLEYKQNFTCIPWDKVTEVGIALSPRFTNTFTTAFPIHVLYHHSRVHKLGKNICKVLPHLYVEASAHLQKRPKVSKWIK